MSYRHEFKQSPNYTPNAQVRGAYGRVRTLEIGAGHWWGDPNAGYSIQGVINSFLNPARQASAHAVIQEGYVVEMVRPEDVSWATNNANPYTYAIELRPSMSAGDKYTCAEWIADMGFHNLPWRPHNQLGNPSTQCNPLPWEEIRALAQQIYAEKHNAPAPAPQPVNADLEWHAYAEGVRKFKLNKAAKLWNFNQTSWAGFGSGIKDFTSGNLIDIKGYVLNKTLNAIYLLTPYSFDNKITNGFNAKDLDLYVPPAPAPDPTPVVPEWQRNIQDITPVKLFVLPAEGVGVINLNNGLELSKLAKGTAIDIVAKTTVGGVEYYVSSYSRTNAMPNGIVSSALGELVTPPANEKPEWLANWRDIEDKKMYLRVDAPLVNLLTGATIKTLKLGEEVQIASATEWHGQAYLISEYSTKTVTAAGIALNHLSDEPIKNPTEPLEPTPTQPTPQPTEPSRDDAQDEKIGALQAAVGGIIALLGSIGSMLLNFVKSLKK